MFKVVMKDHFKQVMKMLWKGSKYFTKGQCRMTAVSQNYINAWVLEGKIPLQKKDEGGIAPPPPK